ncbi:MAG: glycosyltransferase family 39 protein [Proteobacteria bacterium]|nr:glycosyltransferase family 39 protein [Pseudomonadota bacterium]
MTLNWRRTFLALWALELAARIWLAATLPLFSDEAWYWLEGQHPAWAYSDLPGLTAWLARLGTAVGGDTPLGLRWPFLLLGAAVPWLCMRAARRWFDATSGWQAGLLALLIPLASVLGALALPDVPLVFASVLAFDAGLALLATAEADSAPKLEKGEAASPPACGGGVGWGRERRDTRPPERAAACLQLAVALALGALCHYRFLIALAGLAVGVLASREGRALLRDPRVWAALAVGALAWLPLAWFNAHEHVAGLRFQFVERQPWRFHLYGLKLQALQPLLTGPLLYVALLWALWQAGKRRADPRWAFVLGAAGLPLAVFLGLGPFADIHRVSFHWPLSACLLACTPLSWLLREQRWPRWRRWIFASNGLLCTGLWAVALWASLPGAAPRLQPLGVDAASFVRIDALIAGVRERLAAMPADTAVVADDFGLAAKLSFALSDPARVYSLDHRLDAKHGRALQLALWRRDESALPVLRTRPLLLVVDEDALHLEAREPWNRHLCDVLPGLRAVGDIVPQGTHRHFLLYRRDAHVAGACDYPALAFMRSPLPGAALSGQVEVSGWATQDFVGVARVDVLLDGRIAAQAHYGIEDVEVRSRWPASDDPAQPNVGFSAALDLRGVAAGEHTMALRVTGRDGRVRVLERRAIRVQRP